MTQEVTQNFICREHSGIKQNIRKLEANVSELWKKWDDWQRTKTSIFVVLFSNLIAVILTLIVILVKK